MIPVSIEQLHFTTITEGYYSVQFTAVDKETTCLVVANSKTNYATFLKVHKLEPSKINFHQMGINRDETENKKVKTNEKIVQFISVMYQSIDKEIY